MTILLRIMLLVVSVLNLVQVLVRINKAQVKIEDALFWFLFSGMLILMSLFPQLIDLGAELTGVQSSVNFVFLVIIFVLIIKIFRMSIRISQLEAKLQTFVQNYAIDKNQLEHTKQKDAFSEQQAEKETSAK